MARLAIQRSTLVPVAGPSVIYAVGLLTASFAAMSTEEAWQPLLFVFGGSAAFFAWRTLRWPDVAARYLTVGAVLLLACAANRILYVLDFVFAGARLDEWPFPVEQPVGAVFKGEVVTVAGTLITVLTWVAAGGLRVTPMTILRNLVRFRVQLLTIYVLSLAAVMAMQRFPSGAAGLGLLLPTLQALGLVAAILFPLAEFKRALSIVPAVLLLSTPFVLASAGTGMKESIILALLPAGAIVWASTKGVYGRLVVVCIGIVGLSLITSYVGYFREAVWRDRSGTMTTEQTLEAYFDEVQQGGVAPTIADGWSKFLSRSNASIGRGWAVAIADEQAMQPELVFGPLVYVFVPRVFWANKPAIRQGWEFSGLVFGPAYTLWSDSSTAAGFYASLYLGYGWIGVLGGAVLAGYLIAKTSLMAQRIGGDFAAGLYMLALVPFALRMDEQWTVGVFSAPIITLLYVLATVFVVNVVTLRRT